MDALRQSLKGKASAKAVGAFPAHAGRRIARQESASFGGASAQGELRAQ